MNRLRAIVLGAAAGGGFPQWNCGCDVCAEARSSRDNAFARSQCSLAVSGDGEQWIVLNASPDLRAQIAATDVLRPRALRGSPIAAIVLTGGEVDQVAGLLHVRERQPFSLVATAETFAILDDNPIFSVLAPDVVSRQPATLDSTIALPGGLSAELFDIPGKVPLYLEGDGGDLTGRAGTNVGVTITNGTTTMIFAPGIAAMTPALFERLAQADLVFCDGTLFTDDEMIRTGTGVKTGRRMGHMPVSGEDGSLAALSGLANRRVYIHINNTNPMLIEDSPARRQVTAAGWDVARDGMEFTL